MKRFHIPKYNVCRVRTIVQVLADILSKQTRKIKLSNFINSGWIVKNIRYVILDGWNSPELFPNENIMDHISSCRKALGQWKRDRDLNAAKLVEDLK